MTQTDYSTVWDLDVFFQGGSESPALRQHLQQTKAYIEQLEKVAGAFQTPDSAEAVDSVCDLLGLYTTCLLYTREASGVISCYTAADTTDRKAMLLDSERNQLIAQLSTAFLTIQQKLAKTEQSVWNDLLQTESLQPFQFILNEWRDQVQEKCAEREEALITSLSVDGYSAWGQLYDRLVSDLQVTLTIDGVEKTYSIGQANNLTAHENPEVRQHVFEALEKVWAEKEQYFASTLNHLAGFRLAVYRHRGWDNVLKEPLMRNRMREETLDAMWSAIAASKAPFVQYLERKAKLVGKSKIDWYDLNAPSTASAKKMSFQEGAAFILKHFKAFGPELEAFARKAFEDRWIEAEDRSNKRPGGFCTRMPLSEQSRIFMTYSGSMSNVATLAHELGHAFHSYALRSVPFLNQQYAMGVAETASTFAEMIVADAAVKEAETKEEKQFLIEDKIKRSIAFFMNIHARFLFETRFYEERKNGIVAAERLNELMEEAQREAYAGALHTTHPHFWASKLHFYITSVPFYNFPYTFGYLFSLSIYAKALEEGTNFEQKYLALLRDTAVMSVEDLAMKHLGEDITQRAFWEKGIALCIKDVELFLAITDDQ